MNVCVVNGTPTVTNSSRHAEPSTVINRPTRIQSKDGKLRCLIMDMPKNENLDMYIEEMLQWGVTDLVRTCEASYDVARLEEAGIRCHGLIFDDGQNPPDDIIDEWLRITEECGGKKSAVAVHCVAGLGRAPVLVAVALIERGMEGLDAVSYVREQRKGAINKKQMDYLRNYKRRGASSSCCCCIQ